MANICSFLFVQLRVLVLRKGALIDLYLLIKTTKVMAVNKVIFVIVQPLSFCATAEELFVICTWLNDNFRVIRKDTIMTNIRIIMNRR